MDDDQPLADRIQRAAFVLTMIVALAIGATSLGLSLQELPARDRAEHANTLRIVGGRLGSDIRNFTVNLDALSRSSLVSMALTDSAGREAYLKPFLAGRGERPSRGDLALLDHRGRLLAGDLEGDPTRGRQGEAVAAALKEKRPRFAVHTEASRLLAAYPVFLPHSQDAIGVLVGSFDLERHFHNEVAGLNGHHGVALLHGDAVLGRFPAEVTGRHSPVRFPVPVAGEHAVPDLYLEMYSMDSPWIQPVLIRLASSVIIGLVFGLLVWRVAGRVATSLTRRLNRLAVACAGVATGRSFAAEADAAKDEIGLLSRTLCQAIQAHEDIQGHLQQLVEQRTEALNESLERYRRSEERLRLAASVFQHSHEGILLTDADGRIFDINEAFTRITGYSREEVLGQRPNLLRSGHHARDFYLALWTAVMETGHWQGELWNRRKNGELYPELLTISAVRDASGGISHYVGVFADISPIKLHEQQLERIAHYDALTQLPNRVLLADHMRLALAQAKRSETLVGVCYLDLDGFKGINDVHGHAAGDRLLVEVARRLGRTLRAADTVARLGGDEFVLLLVGLHSAEECEEVLQRVIRTVSEPVFQEGAVFSVSASIGVALYPATDDDADVLLRQADLAMYEAKQAGKNRYQLFNPEQDRRVRSYRARLKELEMALERGELLLYYQPKVNLRTGEVVGMEALLRWQHPAQGLLLPGAFLDGLNNPELEVRIDRWVLAAACGQMDAWRAMGISLGVSVNISAAYLESADFVPQIRELLATHRDAARLLELEVLETAALEDLDRVARIMDECRGLGVPFALDDFGTGYSSLTYFRRLPAETLKIDSSFVRDMLEDPDDSAIVEGVIGLTRAFGRKVVAEGVETAAHGRALCGLGCEIAQGFGIARPMPAEAVPGWLSTWLRSPVWQEAGEAAEVS
ncbi:MAG: hypothetical protein H6R10_1979 [Rhodocyclaceae bacterium]|nr:hypothetical protein [Rhodocyclaceae bacterium]